MKTPEEIIKQYSPNPTFGYGSSWIKNAMKEYAYEMLDRYTEFLQKEGYIDTDATMEHPTAIDMFLKQERN